MIKKTPELVTRAKILRCRRLSYKNISEKLGVSPMTLNRWLNPAVLARKRVYDKAWKKTNSEKHNSYSRNWRKANPEKQRASCLAWEKANPGYRWRYVSERLKTDLNFRIATRLRIRLNDAIKNNSKRGSAVRDLGCSIEDLKLRLEFLFQRGMTWENYGSVWHIDHVRPLASFDLTDEFQFLQAVNFTNLQPLLAEENKSKGAKYAIS